MHAPFFLAMEEKDTFFNDITSAFNSGDSQSLANQLYDTETMWKGKTAFRDSLGKQLFTQSLQNQWESAPAQMERAKSAGINPLTAAAGIVGNAAGASAMPAPASAADSGINPAEVAAAGLDASAQVANAITGGNKASTEAEDIRQTRELRKQQLFIGNKKMFTEIGFTEMQSAAMAIQLKYMDEKEQKSIALIAANIDDVAASARERDQHISNLKKEIDMLDQQISESKARQDLVKAQEYKTYKDALLTESQTFEQNWNNNFMQVYGLNPKLPIVNGMITSKLEGKDDVVSTITNGVYDYNYNLAGGEQAAIQDHAYNIALARKQGENISDVITGRVGSWADAIGRASYHIGGHVEDVVNGISNLIKGKSDSEKPSIIRNKLSEAIATASAQVGKDPNKDEAIANLIYSLSVGLSLTDNELLEWYQSSGLK